MPASSNETAASAQLSSSTRVSRDLRASSVLALVAAAQFMVVLDATVVNVALPTIQRSVGFSEQSLSWVLNAYTLIFGGFLLLGGRLADTLGRRRLFVAGGGPFLGGVVVLGLSGAGGGAPRRPRPPGPRRAPGSPGGAPVH